MARLRAALRAARPEAAGLPAPRPRRAFPARSASPAPPATRGAFGPFRDRARPRAAVEALHQLFRCGPATSSSSRARPAARACPASTRRCAPARRPASRASARTTTARWRRGRRLPGRSRGPSGRGARARSRPGCRGRRRARGRHRGRRATARALSRWTRARVFEDGAVRATPEGDGRSAGRRCAGPSPPRARRLALAARLAARAAAQGRRLARRVRGVLAAAGTLGA